MGIGKSKKKNFNYLKSKKSTIELRVMEKEETMSPIEKLLYESTLKNKKKEWQERQQKSI